MTVIKDVMEKPSFFITDFEGSYQVLLRHNIFDLQVFHNEKMAFLNFFEFGTEIHFVSLFFVNKGNITTALLMIHLKCILCIMLI